MHRQQHIAWYYISTIGALLIWSTSFIATKLAYQTFPPITLGAARFVVASIVLGLVKLIKREHVRPTMREFLEIGLSGALGIALYFVLENYGLSMTAAINAALIVASFPAITLIMEWAIYRAPISRVKLLGVAIAIAGVYLLTAQGATEQGGKSLIGNLLLLATGVAWAAYIFATRKVVNRFPAITLSFYQTLAGTALLLPLSLIERGGWRLPTSQTAALTLYLGVMCSVVAYLLYNFGLRKLPAATSASLLNLMPIFGSAFSMMVLGERLTYIQLIGGALVIAGVFVSARRETRRESGLDVSQ